jgi:hypothetical protein
MKKIFLFVALAISSMFIYSCSKQDLSGPATSRDQDAAATTTSAPSGNAVNNYTDDELLGTSLLAGEQLVSDVSPGLYRIAKFIDTGDDETAQFNGYKFRFKDNGDLIATTNTGQVFTGKWNLNSQETRMELRIGGNAALKDLDDDDWRVRLLTDQRIRISAPDPDIVVFVKI